jgi:hypothetical protein
MISAGEGSHTGRNDVSFIFYVIAGGSDESPSISQENMQRMQDNQEARGNNGDMPVKPAP